MLQTTETARRMLHPVHGSCRVAIIGGGFSGASVARLLALDPSTEGQVVVFEPRETLGAGLAYDTANPVLRLNVAAHRMAALPDKPDAFTQFLQSSGRLARDPDARRGDAIYARRCDFGAFMQAELQPLLQSEAITHIRERIETVTRKGRHWLVRGDKGTTYLAEALVLALGNAAASPPGLLAHGAAGHPRFIADGTDSARIRRIEPDADVLVVGSGLTGLDIAACLEKREHRGRITLMSRSGLLPMPQASSYVGSVADFEIEPGKTARSLLRQVRQRVEEAEAAGLPWQSVFDALRRQGQDIWRMLDDREQQRLLRHMRRRFEIHRFRMPPQISEALERLETTDRLRICAGRLVRVEPGDRGISVDLLLKEGLVERKSYDWVIAATGVQGASLLRTQDWLANLAADGHVRPDIHGFGIDCDGKSRAIGTDGTARPDILVAGPITRGRFGEITGVPEIARQARAIVRQLTASGTTTARPARM